MKDFVTTWTGRQRLFRTVSVAAWAMFLSGIGLYALSATKWSVLVVDGVVCRLGRDPSSADRGSVVSGNGRSSGNGCWGARILPVEAPDPRIFFWLPTFVSFVGFFWLIESLHPWGGDDNPVSPMTAIFLAPAYCLLHAAVASRQVCRDWNSLSGGQPVLE